MQFIAKIRLGSYIDRSWRSQDRLGGTIYGVGFKRVGTGVLGLYESTAPLTTDQVAIISSHPDVQLVAVGTIPTAPVPVPDPEPELVPAPAPKAPVKTLSTEES